MTVERGLYNDPWRPSVNEKARVLVVDDDEVLRELVTAALAYSRFEVTTASNGYTALALIEEQLPDLLVLDVMMPDMSGVEVCRQLRSTYRTMTLPIIMLTAHTQVQDQHDGFMAGADLYLAKPFRPRALLANVDKLLAS